METSIYSALGKSTFENLWAAALGFEKTNLTRSENSYFLFGTPYSYFNTTQEGML